MSFSAGSEKTMGDESRHSSDEININVSPDGKIYGIELLIMQIVALSDLHGIRVRFEKARRLLDNGIKVVLLAL
jgi:uncharacterized protein YuzE